jgi:hypothetical protein
MKSLAGSYLGQDVSLLNRCSPSAHLLLGTAPRKFVPNVGKLPKDAEQRLEQVLLVSRVQKRF